MSRPRKPFGSSHPGRLPATMMKVLAAEMTDPSRLRRGKQYAKDGSVLDIIIEPGVVTGEIQGSRSTPYVASVVVTAGDGMPLRRDITTTCTCPDDDNWDDYACKHVVATMFSLSDEFLVEPELLDVWRQRDLGSDLPETGDSDVAEIPDVEDEFGPTADSGARPSGGRGERHLRLVGAERRPSPAPRADPLDGLLSVPEGFALPGIDDIDRIEPVPPRARDLAGILRSAIGHLRIEWD